MTDTQTPSPEDAVFDPETGARDIIDLSAPDQPSDQAETPSRPSAAELTDVEMSNITQNVIKQLKTVYDPEIPVDIYELGLIYKVDFDPANEERGSKITVDMTLTAPGCPVAGEMPGWVEDAVLNAEGVDEVSINMTFEPPWTPDRMSDEAKLELGWM